jgi:hypothetical protein
MKRNISHLKNLKYFNLPINKLFIELRSTVHRIEIGGDLDSMNSLLMGRL